MYNHKRVPGAIDTPQDGNYSNTYFRAGLRQHGPARSTKKGKRKPKKKKFCKRHPNGGIRCDDCSRVRKGHSVAEQRAHKRKVHRTLKAKTQKTLTHKPPTMTVAGLRAEFRRFDMNGDGRINRQELMKVLMNAGLEQKEAEKNTQDFFRLCDGDNNGWVSCDEFVTEYKRMMHFRSFAYLRKNFNALDQMDGDKDGQISKETFFQVLVAKLGEEEARIELDRIFSLIDVDNSDSISFKEWCDWYHHEADQIQKNREILMMNSKKLGSHNRISAIPPNFRKIIAHLDDSLNEHGHRLQHNHVRPVLVFDLNLDGVTLAGLSDAVADAFSKDEKVGRDYEFDSSLPMRLTKAKAIKARGEMHYDHEYALDTNEKLRHELRTLQSGQSLEIQVPCWHLCYLDE